MHRPRAFVRQVPDSFSRAMTSAPTDSPLDPDEARSQHADYAAVLALGGFAVGVIPADEAFPDWR